MGTEIECLHGNARSEDWPDGVIEVCNDCGMSRYLWEQGKSDWVTVKALWHLLESCCNELDSNVTLLLRERRLP